MASHTPPAVPDLLPLPAAGRHLDPADGACLMEAASLLAGEPFSDHPHCVHPTVAALARLLNDATTTAGRAALWRLLPDLVANPAGSARTAPAVVLHVLTVVGAGCDVGLLGRLARRRAARRLARLDRGGLPACWVRATDALYRRAPAERGLRRALAHLARVADGDLIDRRAADLLGACAHGATPGPAVELVGVGAAGAAPGEAVPRRHGRMSGNGGAEALFASRGRPNRSSIQRSVE
ncbi:MAG: hypothetical protein EPN43_13925 [Jatrophihabitans sp.]|nr:MAG: hypothetical protein EPN43_13925 [Jatrophihabitans sp.]